MIKGRLEDSNVTISSLETCNILKQAKESYENYLIRDCEVDLEKAIDYYFEALRRDPSIPEAYYKLASLLYERGQIDINSALTQCEKAIKLDPKSSQARLYMGYFLKTSGRYREAELSFKKAIKLNKFFSAKPRIALGALKIQNLDSKKLEYNDILEGSYYFGSGLVMYLWDIYSIRMLLKSIFEDIYLCSYKIKGDFYRKINKFEKAVAVYESAAINTGKPDMFYSEIGDMSIEAGNLDLAAESYKSALKTSPENIILWAKLANILQKTDYDNVDGLLECYNNISDLDPTNARVYYELGHLYIKLDDKFSAINAFKKAVEIDSDNPFFHNSLAFTLVQLQDYDGAISEYQKAIKLNPDNEWTSVVSQALGAIYHQVKRNMDAAIVSYQTSIVLDSFNLDAFIALGEIYQEMHDYNNAIDCYCQVIKQDPEIPKVYCNLGLALWERDYTDEAIIAFQKAISVNPKYDIAYNNLGVVYLDGVGNPDEALVQFNQALKYNPNYALAYYNKGRACQILCNKVDAADAYQMALNINKLSGELNEAEIQHRIYELFDV